MAYLPGVGEVKVLITGGKGQLGQAFEEGFTKEGIPFASLGHEALDITDLRKVREVVREGRFTHIVNCAAYTRVDDAEKNWRHAYLVNGLGVRNLALAAQETRSLLVHFSTDYVFDGEKGTPYTIFDAPHPINRYGESKLLGERFLPLAEKWILIRTSWVFGTGGRNFATRLLSWAEEKEELAIAEDEVSAPTFTEDLVRATLLLMREEALGLYHVTNSPASRFAWAAYILHRIGWKGKLRRAKQEDFCLPARRPRYSVLDNFGLQETTGFSMPSFEEATDRFLRKVGML